MTIGDSAPILSCPLEPPRSFESYQGTQGLRKDRPNLLVISPYTEVSHRLDLDTLKLQEQQLAIALTDLRSLRQDYATCPYVEIFNWSEVVTTLRQLASASGDVWKVQTFYIVVFRSQIPPTTDYSHLGSLDKAAFAEAVKSGGFLKYWFGHPDHQGRNLATCIWRSRDDARRGGVGEAHRRASAATRNLYSDWNIERLALVIKDDATDWNITPWIDEV